MYNNLYLQALYYTGNESADAAASFYFDNPDIQGTSLSIVDYNNDQNSAESILLTEDSSDEENDKLEQLKFKMVFIVNTSLKMGVGTIAVQVWDRSVLFVLRLCVQTFVA